MVLGLVGASRSGSAIRGGGADDGTARAEAERRAGHPGRMVRVGEVLCSVLVRAWERREEERRKKGEGKKKRRKRKREKGKRGKGEKEKETPAGFAATVVSRAWRRRGATRTRNEGNRKKRR